MWPDRGLINLRVARTATAVSRRDTPRTPMCPERSPSVHRCPWPCAVRVPCDLLKVLCCDGPSPGSDGSLASPRCSVLCELSFYSCTMLSPDPTVRQYFPTGIRQGSDSVPTVFRQGSDSVPTVFRQCPTVFRQSRVRQCSDSVIPTVSDSKVTAKSAVGGASIPTVIPTVRQFRQSSATYNTCNMGPTTHTQLSPTQPESRLIVY